ncbi:hypothetical protein Cni_G03533 [Canna indica]|uniref:LysM domain-containing protein n=1 Tax=Canna indica TaxID=4628 RepID=A0AAQ3JSM1_9LILI|nr:hypothetical protein Cni_G03533 [Canna indica]
MGSLSQEGKVDAFASFPSEIHSSSSSCSYSANSSSSSSDAKYIEHTISKLDTLAGIAIKYGVEISDIKRINGLTTDLQMFAHKSLFIPLPGKHPPSPPIQSSGFVNDRDQSPTRYPQREVLDSLQSPKLKSHLSGEISPAMNSLQKYYGLPPHKKGSTVEGTEMTVYRSGGSQYLEDDEPLPKVSPAADTQPGRSADLLKSYITDNADLLQNLLVTKSGDAGDGEKAKFDKSVRRRPKADTDTLSTPDAVVKDESKGLIGRIGRGLALKALFTSQTDMEPARQSTSPAEDSSVANVFLAVRKSSSTSSLQESTNDSIWTSSKWTLKSDSVARPIFSALPKQITVWRSKAALD